LKDFSFLFSEHFLVREPKTMKSNEAMLAGCVPSATPHRARRGRFIPAAPSRRQKTMVQHAARQRLSAKREAVAKSKRLAARQSEQNTVEHNTDSAYECVYARWGTDGWGGDCGCGCCGSTSREDSWVRFRQQLKCAICMTDEIQRRGNYTSMPCCGCEDSTICYCTDCIRTVCSPAASASSAHLFGLRPPCPKCPTCRAPIWIDGDGTVETGDAAVSAAQAASPVGLSMGEEAAGIRGPSFWHAELLEAEAHLNDDDTELLHLPHHVLRLRLDGRRAYNRQLGVGAYHLVQQRMAESLAYHLEQQRLAESSFLSVMDNFRAIEQAHAVLQAPPSAAVQREAEMRWRRAALQAPLVGYGRRDQPFPGTRATARARAEQAAAVRAAEQAKWRASLRNARLQQGQQQRAQRRQQKSQQTQQQARPSPAKQQRRFTGRGR
jgi:hypothetical protein